MSDPTLRTLHDHAARMATAEHTDECCAWAGQHALRNPVIRPDPTCPGCVTDADRELWRQIADEIDAHLADDDEESLL